MVLSLGLDIDRVQDPFALWKSDCITLQVTTLDKRTMDVKD